MALAVPEEHRADYMRIHAIMDYSEAAWLNPKDAGAFNNRGLSYFTKGNHNRAIADYDAAIRVNPKFAGAILKRGTAYRTRGDFDRAIADYDEVIRLNPKFAGLFNARGLAYSGKGDYDLAIADYNETIRLDPKYVRAFNNRSFAYSAKGDYGRAIADYNEVMRIDPKIAFRNRVFFYSGDFEKAVAALLLTDDLRDDPYAMLWRYLARGHMGQDGGAELSVNATRLKTTNWPHAVIDFYLGRRSLDEMRAAAANANEQCESAFFAGEWQLLRGNKAEARASLQVVVDTCAKTSGEYPGAISELRRLGQ